MFRKGRTNIMKRIKIIISLFIFSSIFAVTSVAAANSIGFLGMADITIPIFGNVYTSATVSKTELGNQYAMIDESSKDIMGAIKGVALFTKLSKSSYTQLQNSNSGYGLVKDDYNIQLKTATSQWTTTSAWASWILNGSLIGK